MSNDKQQSAVEFYLDKVFDIIGDAILNKLSIEQINKIHDLSKQAKEMHKEEMINFHIEVMKLGLNQEGERIWEEAYLPKISSIATQKYTETYGGNK
jgi:hypothetical protein